MKKYLAILLITLLSQTSFALETVIEVIPLNNRPASELLPLLAPLMGNSAQLIDNGSNIIVKTSPDQLAEIKKIIDQLDVKQSNLLITVMQSTQTTADELNTKAQITVSNNAKILGHLYQTQAKSADENVQTIRTLEGVAAHIQMGNIYPRQNYSLYGYPTSTQYTEATTGFAVIPRITGDQVTLSVSPWSDRMNGQGQIATENAQATIRVNFGEWVELGGVGENSSTSTNGTLVNIHQTDKNQLHILVKVERVD